MFFLEGKGEHFNDFQIYAIETSSIVCVSPGQVHFWRNEGSLRGPMICFTQEFAEKYASADYSVLQHRFWFPAGNSPVIQVSKEQARETALLIEEIQREFNGRAEGSDRIVRLLLQLILLKMNRFLIVSFGVRPEIRRRNFGNNVGSPQYTEKLSIGQ